MRHVLVIYLKLDSRTEWYLRSCTAASTRTLHSRCNTEPPKSNRHYQSGLILFPGFNVLLGNVCRKQMHEDDSHLADSEFKFIKLSAVTITPWVPLGPHRVSKSIQILSSPTGHGSHLLLRLSPLFLQSNSRRSHSRNTIWWNGAITKFRSMVSSASHHLTAPPLTELPTSRERTRGRIHFHGIWPDMTHRRLVPASQVPSLCSCGWRILAVCWLGGKEKSGLTIVQCTHDFSLIL